VSVPLPVANLLISSAVNDCDDVVYYSLHCMMSINLVILYSCRSRPSISTVCCADIIVTVML